jgi:transketolase
VSSTQASPKATRQAFGEVLAELGGSHPEIVVLDADLAKSTKSELFGKKYPDRFFEMGIAEANMIGTAAGLSFMGKLPFLCSFGCFLTGRYDTIRLSVAYSGANVRLIGTHAGVGIGDDGHSQMGLEDISLMRALPTMGVFQPMDAVETTLLMKELVTTWKGPAYVRLTRQNLPQLLDPTKHGWKFGKLCEVFPAPAASGGSSQAKKRVVCIASGASVAEAVQASEKLALQGVAMSVWNAHSLKPFDAAKTRELAGACDQLITVEDHSVIGGLGSCVEEAISSLSKHAPLRKFGVQDLFGESGEGPELYEKHGISAEALVRSILN